MPTSSAMSWKLKPWKLRVWISLCAEFRILSLVSI